MKKALLVLLMILLPSVALAGAADSVEEPKSCVRCGMDRAVFARSRMLVAYADGTSLGVCSLHCAAEELQRNGGKQVSSLMVADYTTKMLVDARTATWVVGGKKPGVMTALAKWAFAKAEAAGKFVEENGGIVKPFDRALAAAIMEVQAQAAEEKAVEKEMLLELK